MSPSAPARSNAVIDEGRPCRSCASSRKMEFNGEICMHFPGGLESLNKPLLWVYPKVVVCLNCGFAEFNIPETELELIQQNL
jgi:hypothetical protein